MQICFLPVLFKTPDTNYHIINKNQVFPLERVNSTVDLGVNFDSNLTFRNHISEKN